MQCSLVLAGQMAVCVYVAAILFLRISNRVCMYVCTFVRLYVHLKLLLPWSHKFQVGRLFLKAVSDGRCSARWHHVDRLNCVSVTYRTLYVIVLQNSDTQAAAGSNSILSRFCEVKSVFPYALWTHILEHSTKGIYSSTVRDVCYWAHELFSCIWVVPSVLKPWITC